MSVPPPVPGPARDPARPSPDADRGGNGLAVAGFTLSVAGVVLGFSPLLSIAGLVCAVLGLVFSAAGRRAVRADPRRPHRAGPTAAWRSPARSSSSSRSSCRSAGSSS